MDKALAQFELKDGTPFLVEIEEPSSNAVERVSLDQTGEMVYKAKQSLDNALESIRPVATTVVTKLKSGLTTPADEVEVTFGLKLSAEAGVVFSSVGSEVTFQVKLKWKQ